MEGVPTGSVLRFEFTSVHCAKLYCTRPYRQLSQIGCPRTSDLLGPESVNIAMKENEPFLSERTGSGNPSALQPDFEPKMISFGPTRQRPPYSQGLCELSRCLTFEIKTRVNNSVSTLVTWPAGDLALSANPTLSRNVVMECLRVGTTTQGSQSAQFPSHWQVSALRNQLSLPSICLGECSDNTIGQTSKPATIELLTEM